MKIVILGCGLMGPAAAWNALRDPSVSTVLLCDQDEEALARAADKLGSLTASAPWTGNDRLKMVQLRLEETESVAAQLEGAAVVLAALPSTIVPVALHAALMARVPWVDLTWPPVGALDELRAGIREAEVPVLFGCGVEPGLTEILARSLAKRFDSVDALHIKCGGIPQEPAGPLQYKIVFGGSRMPLRESDGYAVVEGALVITPRYGDVEHFHVDGVGTLEAWNETFMPWLVELKEFRGLRTGTQKTVRWPGYGDRVRVLKELGLLSLDPVQVKGVKVRPKELVDAVLYPSVAMRDGERDLTVLRVDIEGKRKGRARRASVEMVDRYDEVTGITSMARTTAFTGMIIARMVARGEIRDAGIRSPEQVITGKHFDRLIAELADEGVRFLLRSERLQVL